MIEMLAIGGGTPIRTEPLPPPYPGASILGERERLSILAVIDSRSPFRFYGPRVQGKVRDAEARLASLVGVPHALAVSSGTAALVVALRALGVGLGDEVIVPAVTFMASPLAVIACNAVPVFAEVDHSFCLDAADAESRITSRTRAIMPVHLLGVACGMDAICHVARRHGLRVVEDCAQSLGASWRGRPIGGLGDVGAFSFQLNKVATGGEGGAVTTSDPLLHERAVRAHDQGSLREGEGKVPEFCGENYRMSELTGAVVSVQLERLWEIIPPIRRIKQRMRAALSGIADLRLRKVPDPAGDVGVSVAFSLPSEAASRGFEYALAGEGIDCRRVYGGKPVYAVERIRFKRTWDGRGTPFSHHPDGLTPYADGLCPRTEDLLGRSLAFSLSPAWTNKDVDDALTGVHKVLRLAPIDVLERIGSDPE